MSDASEYRLVIEFPDQSPSFVHGYEAGCVAIRMQRSETIDTSDGFPLHAANETVLRAMAAYYGYELDVSPIPDCDEYVNVRARKVRPTGANFRTSLKLVGK